MLTVRYIHIPYLTHIFSHPTRQSAPTQTRPRCLFYRIQSFLFLLGASCVGGKWQNARLNPSKLLPHVFLFGSRSIFYFFFTRNEKNPWIIQWHREEKAIFFFVLLQQMLPDAAAGIAFSNLLSSFYVKATSSLVFVSSLTTLSTSFVDSSWSQGGNYRPERSP